MQTGLKPTNIIINQILNIIITDKELKNLINGPKYIFKNLINRKKVFSKIRNIGKQYNTYSGVYI
jgi:hypothetical protein